MRGWIPVPVKRWVRRTRLLARYSGLVVQHLATDSWARVDALPSLAGCFPEWSLTLMGGELTPMDLGLPWISFPALNRLRSLVRPTWRVFEYGTGGSSVFFSRTCREVLAVEHDPAWHRRLLEQGWPERLPNWHPVLVEADPGKAGGGDPAAVGSAVSAAPGWEGRTFAAYAASIGAVAEGGFDLVLIDGRARPACFLAALPHVRPGGFVVWDNSERERYWPTMDAVPASFSRIDYPGPPPQVPVIGRTTLWQRAAGDRFP